MKKILCIILSCLMIFSAGALGISALDSGRTVAGAPTVFAEDLTVNAGDILRVPVQIKDNTGIMGWMLSFAYDTDFLTPLTVEYGEVISSGVQDNIEGNMVPGSINVYWAGYNNAVYNGIMIYINFAVNAAAVGDTTIDISFSQPDTFDGYFNDVYLNCEPINVSITNAGYSQYAKVNASAQDVVAGEEVQLSLNLSEINGVTEADVDVEYNAANFAFETAVSDGVQVESTASDGRVSLRISGITTAVNNTDCITLRFKCKDKAMAGSYDFVLSSPTEGVLCKGCSIQVSPSATSAIAEIYAEDVEGVHNDVVTIPVRIANNHGIMGYRLRFSFDAELLEPVSATVGDIKGYSFATNIGLNSGRFDALWVNTENIIQDGVLFNMTFRILTDKTVDTSIAVSYSQEDTFNESWEDVIFACRDISLSLNPHQHSYTATVTPPTCTEKGYTTYTCSCGDKYVADAVDPLGHQWGEYSSNNDATFDADGTKTAVCSVCGATDTVADVGSQLARDPDLCIKTVSLSLQSSFKMNFKVPRSALAGYTSPYMVFRCEDLDEMTVTDYTEQGEYYVFSFPGISPKMMNNDVTAQAYATNPEDGRLYASEPRTMSVRQYAYKMLELYADDATAQAGKLKTLLVDMLHYGAKAQMYTDYKTDALVDADLSDAQKAWGTAVTPELSSITDASYIPIDNPTVQWSAAGLVLNDSVKIRAKFTAEKAENLTVQIACAGRTYTYGPEDFVSNGDGSYYVYCNEIKAHQMSEEILLTAYENGVQCSDTMRFSVESYAKAVQNSEFAGTALDNLTQAMMCYGKSAEAYGI